MCSCLKQLPCEFADRAGAVCKTGGGGGKEGRVALGPIRDFPSRRWEFSSKAAGARARSQSSSGARRKSLARPLRSRAPGRDQPAPRRAMNRLPQLLLWVTTVAVVFCSGSHEENSSSPNPTRKLSLMKNKMVSLHQPSTPEISCIIGSSCSWVTSTDSFGKPDWVLSSIGVLASQERQQTLMENSSSNGDVEGYIFLLNTSRLPDRCEFSLQSPILPGSLDSCMLELAICSQDTVPLLQRFAVEIRYAETNKNTVTSLRPGHEENAGMKWKHLVAQIGRIERPFKITLVYSNCGAQEVGVLAVGSLQLRNCFHDKGNQDLFVYDKGSTFPCFHGGCVSHLQICEFSSDCPIKEEEGVRYSLPEGSHCSFEEGLCGWTLNETAASPWSIRGFSEMIQEDSFVGSTLQATGGHFLYVRADSTQTSGMAKAYSTILPASLATEDYQIQFSVHVFGSYNGTVSFFLREEIKGAPITLPMWERAGSWSDHWFLITLPMPVLQNRFQLELLATWGWNSQADIAIDNITFGLDCFTDGRQLNHFGGKRHYPREISIMDEHLLNPLEEPSLPGDTTVVLWWFSTCGASGPHGPTQAQCDSAYKNSNVSVTVEKEGRLRGVQIWRVPATNRYRISAYGAAGGKGAKNHNKRSHGVFISATFHLEKDELLYILVGQQGEDACPGGNPETQKICLGESSLIEEDYKKKRDLKEWAGGGGGGGGATYIFRQKDGIFEPLLIAAGGGGKAYLKAQDNSLDDVPLEQFENSTAVPGVSGRTGAAGGGGGWQDESLLPQAGKSLLEGGEGGQACPQALAKLQWTTSGGFGGGGGACTSGGGGGGYRGGHASDSDDITAGGQDGISFVNPIGEIFLHPLAAMESHGEVEVQIYLNCSHCHSDNCKRDPDTNLPVCQCEMGAVLANDNVTCTVPQGPIPEGQLPLPLLLAVVSVIVVLGMILTCGSLSIIYHLKKQQLEGSRARLQSPEYKLSKIRTSVIMTDYNPNYCFAGKAATLSELKEIPRKNISLLRALGHGAFGEVYEGTVVGIAGDPNPLQVAIKTLPEVCSEQDEMDFLMEALIISKFNHQNIVQCIGVSLQTLPRFILLELMAGGDMKSFLRQNRPRMNQPSTLTMQDLLNIARDIACGCKYLEENHFIHRDIAARNCLLTCTGAGRIAKIGDFGMARDIYRASYYRKGGRAMLPVKWMPPEAFLEGIFTSKTDTWSFGVLLWEIFSLGYMPYPCKTNQEVLEFVTSGGRMDPPKNCPGPVYRIMTQCWQHSPEYRPNFSTILERIKYCTQDPDVINTELPMECNPAPEDEVSMVMRPNISSGIVPLLVSPALTPQTTPKALESHHTGHKLVQCPQELLVENLSNRTARGPSLPCLSDFNSGSWFQQTSNQKLELSNPSAHRLKNKTKNLWNPTYGSWVLENICHFSPSSKLKANPEREDSGFDGNCSSPSSRASPASPSQSNCPHLDISGIELVKLQTFPCGNVNYAYDDLCYSAEHQPSALAEVRAAVLRSSSLHRDEKPFCKKEKTSRERDSGLSLSDDLSVTPV
ncbi:leukocyte tyrosine kinase receptor isoform X2 [Anomalospiza imberbis]|uniref:leukocyte tyrosine kinase receptor isoform X2 n=1 Tax=Anomalospiza imberbis TaxID=187417 RepID=UPI00358E68F9